MTKKHFIALAKAIKEHNKAVGKNIDYTFFKDNQLQTLADFCHSMNPNFNESRWFDFINDKCGCNGGKVKVQA